MGLTETNSVRRSKPALTLGALVVLAATAGAQETVPVALPPATTTVDNNWGLTPLGPDVPAQKWTSKTPQRRAVSNLKVLPATGPRLTLIENKAARAAIVLAADAPKETRAAAQELQRVFDRMAGVLLPMVPESKVTAQGTGADLKLSLDGQPGATLIVLGNSQLSRTAGVTAEGITPEGYHLKTVGNALFVVGADSGDGGTPVAGTRNGVTALLERYFGCRWLWPGDDGEVIPAQTTVTLPPLDETDGPALRQRLMRNMYEKINDRMQTGLRAIGKTDAQWRAQTAPAEAWEERQRLGRSVALRYGHAFEGWWNKYGAGHPDWFALQPNGSRVQQPFRERLNIANPELIQAVAGQAIAELKANPTWTTASISPNDGGPNAFDMSEASRKFDPPQAPKFRFSYNQDGVSKSMMYPSLSDRYATFYSRVAEIVARQYPDRMVGAYAYSAYRTPPLYAKLHPNVLLAFVGLGYFDDSMLARDRESWDGWTHSADKLLLRPNLLLLGHGMPSVYVHKLSADIKHCYETGMIAADFDSIQHNWATQGLNYYVLAHLLWDPSADVDALIHDYCTQGFGKAAPQAQQYFARLETLTNKIAAGNAQRQAEADLRQEEDDRTNDYEKFILSIPRYYTPEVLAELNGLLDSAHEAAGPDSAVQRRIEFLRLGLRYAQAQSSLIAVRNQPASPVNAARIRALLRERQQVFSDIFDHRFYAVNVGYLSYRERDLWKGYE